MKGEFGHTSKKRLDPLTVTFTSPAAAIALFSRVYRGRETEDSSVHVRHMLLQLLRVLRPTLSRLFQIQENLPFQFPKVEADRRAVVYEIPYAQVVLKLLLVVNRSLPVDPIPGNVTNDEFAGKFAPLVSLRRAADYDYPSNWMDQTFRVGTIKTGSTYSYTTRHTSYRWIPIQRLFRQVQNREG